MSLAQIYNDITKQNIMFIICCGNISAATIEMKKMYAICINPFYSQSVAQLKEMLVHEIGHCSTGATHKLASQWDTIQKHEHKANRWAFEHYLPFEMLQQAMKNGYNEAWQLAELLDYPESYINQAIMFYKDNKGFDFNN